MSVWFDKFKTIFQNKPAKIDSLQTFRDFGKTSRRWWGTYQLEAGQSRFWRVGNVVICVDRFSNEWHIASCPVGKVDDLPEEDTTEDHFALPPGEMNFKTFTFRTQAEIALKPVLADRPLASKLERPLYIPGGEEILLYVSSPVWVRVETGVTKITLEEIPTFVLSDTWFGTDTLEGQLCYAGHTYCSPHLKEVPSGPDRIISPMLIKNHSRKILLLEKISVPLPFLSVYSDSDNFLWTEQLYVYREGDEHPEVEVAKGPPKALEDIQRLTPARKELHAASGIKNIFNSLVWD